MMDSLLEQNVCNFHTFNEVNSIHPNDFIKVRGQKILNGVGPALQRVFRPYQLDDIGAFEAWLLWNCSHNGRKFAFEIAFAIFEQAEKLPMPLDDYKKWINKRIDTVVEEELALFSSLSSDSIPSLHCKSQPTPFYIKINGVMYQIHAPGGCINSISIHHLPEQQSKPPVQQSNHFDTLDGCPVAKRAKEITEEFIDVADCFSNEELKDMIRKYPDL